jgi:hypothetical protein
MNLQQPIRPSTSPDPLLALIRQSPSAKTILDYLQTAVPGLDNLPLDIPQTTYTLYRQFARTGERANYEERYFAKRSLLTRAVVEMILGNESMLDTVHDLLWSICEETSWVLPAHEEPVPGFSADSSGESIARLTHQPDFIDLFAAETGASLAEAVHLLGDRLAPEVAQRVWQEVEHRVLQSYLAYGRSYWWHKGDLNWNAVCNGAVGLAFMRLEHDPQRLAEALTIVLEGLDAYVAAGFEADGGSLEGIAYWHYGLLYYVALAELLREHTDGQLDLLADPRLTEIARFPLAMALAPGIFVNFGDASEHVELRPGIMQRLAERTNQSALKGLILPPNPQDKQGNPTTRLAIILRDIAWWDGQPQAFPAAAQEDFYLPSCAIARFGAQSLQGQTVILAAKAGRNDGHHYHTDIGHFIVNLGGESLLCDPGPGLYTREYFGQGRFENVFCSSLGHSVPRIGGQLQMPGPKFGGGRLAEGRIVERRQTGDEKIVEIDFASLYALAGLALARRKLRLVAHTGEIWLEDTFKFGAAPLEIEEAFVTWHSVSVNGSTARISSLQNTLHLAIREPAGASFGVLLLEAECRANHRSETLTRLVSNLPLETRRFVVQITIADEKR